MKSKPTKKLPKTADELGALTVSVVTSVTAFVINAMREKHALQVTEQSIGKAITTLNTVRAALRTGSPPSLPPSSDPKWIAFAQAGLALEQAKISRDACFERIQTMDSELDAVLTKHQKLLEYLNNLVRPLEKFRYGAGLRAQLKARDDRHHAGFDPEAKYQASREFQYDGQEFAKGAVVDKHIIDSRTLGLLYDARRVFLVEPDTI